MDAAPSPLPAHPLVPKEATYLDAFKRRHPNSSYVKPRVEIIKRTSRDYMETFDTFEPLFRPRKKHIRPENSYEQPFRRGPGTGWEEFKIGHLAGAGCSAIVTPNGEVWRPGKRIFVPVSGSFSERVFRPSLRYIPGTLSDEYKWRSCIRCPCDAVDCHFPRRARRLYVPNPHGTFKDIYQPLTFSEFHSGVYTPRKVTKYKPEMIAFTPSGIPYLKPSKKCPRRKLQLHLFTPDPTRKRPIYKPVASYFKQHPQLQLFSANYKDEFTRAHPEYLSGTRYIPEGHYVSFEDGKMTLLPDLIPPEPLGAQPVPLHCPPYNEVRANPIYLPDVIDVDVLETKPAEKRRPHTVPEVIREEVYKVPSPSPRYVTEYMRSYSRGKCPKKCSVRSRRRL